MTTREPSLRDIERLVSSLTAKQDAAASYSILDQIVKSTYDHKLLTILRFIEADSEVERLYSSDTQAYPLLGRKQKQDTVWGRIVLDQGQPLVSRNADDIRENFSDFETIFALGISGMINMPIIWDGRVLGSVNISHDAGHFGEADAGPLAVLVGIIAPLVAKTP